MKPSKIRPSLLSRLSLALSRYGVLAGQTIVVAISGGPDSVCLADLLRELSKEQGFSLHLAHLNHLFRPEAKDEAHFVANLAQQWNVPLSADEIRVSDFCTQQKIGKQQGARIKRYAFLETIRHTVGAQWIALGHNADDQAETLLMRLIRGSGVVGLTGIPEQRGSHIIRPLLDVSRRDILQCLSEQDIPFVEDPSNQNTNYLRNDIRHRILPQLETINPKIKTSLQRASSILKSEEDFVHQNLLLALPKLGITQSQSQLRCERLAFQHLHIALQRRFLRWALEQIDSPMQNIGFDLIETLRLALFEGSPHTKIHLPGGASLSLKTGTFALTLEKKSRSRDKPDPIKTPSPTVRLPYSGSVPGKIQHIEVPEWQLQLQILVTTKTQWQQQPWPKSQQIALFDLAKISGPLSLRGWRPGDRFFPEGMRGHSKKLQDFFVDLKIPQTQRSKIPLLLCQDKIIWIPGHRADEHFIVTKTTERVLAIEAQDL